MPLNVSEVIEKGTVVVGSQPRAKRQGEVIAFLNKHKEQAFTQKEIADELGVESPQANRILHTLMKKGIVDRREVEVQIGEEMVPRIHWHWNQ